MRQGVGASVGQRAKLTTSTRVDPRVVLASQMLQLNQVELEQAVSSELVENPALERIEYEDPLTEEDILRSIAPDELKRSSTDYEAARSLPQDSDGLSWLDMAQSTDSLWDHLMAQLTATLPEEMHTLAAYCVGSVDDRGYMTASVEEAALDCDASLEDAEMVFAALKDCEPAGVGAETLQECLLLQLRDVKTDPEQLARHLVESRWDDLVARNARAIVRRCKVTEELVQDAFDVILSLNPYPGEGFGPSSNSAEFSRSVAARPDLIVRLTEAGWEVEVPGFGVDSLRVTRSYVKRADEIENGARAASQEKRHVMEFVERAHRFLDALRQRRQLMMNLGKYLVDNQNGYVKTGDYKFLENLTRSKVAKELGVHESTISRATRGKYIQIATGEVVSFDIFFKPALRIQKMIEEILSTENPSSPLSDERIAEILAQRGIKVARRTVNKYRDRKRLLSSRRRRTA